MDEAKCHTGTEAVFSVPAGVGGFPTLEGEWTIYLAQVET